MGESRVEVRGWVVRVIGWRDWEEVLDSGCDVVQIKGPGSMQDIKPDFR